jgi:hypothetical protein
MSRGLSIYQQAILQRIRKRGSINIVDVCNLVLTVRGLKKDPSFKPSIWTQIESLEELGSDAQGIYRMMRSLEKKVWLQDFFIEGLQFGTISPGTMEGQDSNRYLLSLISTM